MRFTQYWWDLLSIAEIYSVLLRFTQYGWDLLSVAEICSNWIFFFLSCSASGTNQGAIDNRIEQAMDLVKSHLMNAVRSEVEELKEKIIKLEETISQQQMEISKQHTDFNREIGKLQAENEFLKSQVPPEVLVQLSNIQPQQQPQQQQYQ